MDVIRFGVIGLGFGQHHVRTLANMPEAKLVAVADRSPDLPGGLNGFAAAYGATAYRDGVEMIEREELDAVSICTPRKMIARAAASTSRTRAPPPIQTCSPTTDTAWIAPPPDRLTSTRSQLAPPSVERRMRLTCRRKTRRSFRCTRRRRAACRTA